MMLIAAQPLLEYRRGIFMDTAQKTAPPRQITLFAVYLSPDGSRSPP
jgi:hypothetical protein